MQQITLDDFDPQRAEQANECLPDTAQSVFFKTTDGRTFEGEYFGDYRGGWFESKEADFHSDEVELWHPKVCDL